MSFILLTKNIYQRVNVIPSYIILVCLLTTKLKGENYLIQLLIKKKNTSVKREGYVFSNV